MSSSSSSTSPGPSTSRKRKEAPSPPSSPRLAPRGQHIASLHADRSTFRFDYVEQASPAAQARLKAYTAESALHSIHQDLIDARKSLAAADKTISRMTKELKEANNKAERLQAKLNLFLGAVDAVHALDDNDAPQS
ncbi:hypothetical protein OC844_002066 [Tilletia horrida]|nr:hypothetical protein OC844_002066 [Tilletia horrida]